MRFPSIAVVAHVLRGIDTTHPETWSLPEDERWIDVRLQVLENGTWAIHTGNSSYDQDHRGYWGASCLPMHGTGRFNARDVAKDLIEQARDMRAQGELTL